MRKMPLVILTGPTAVGKTALSILLAKAIGGEIISADSMQVYRHMDIGSAKVTREEMQGVPHYLIDCYEPDEEFHVVEFQRAAREAMKEIWSHGHIPIVAGGTGFYIQALVKDIDFTETEGDETYRKKLEALAAEKGAEYLHALLSEADPKAAGEKSMQTILNGRSVRWSITILPVSGFLIITKKKTEVFSVQFCLFCAEPRPGGTVPPDRSASGSDDAEWTPGRSAETEENGLYKEYGLHAGTWL